MSADLTRDEARVLRALSTAAQEGGKCPSNNRLCEIIGCASPSRPAKIVATLEAKGLITVERFNSARRVTIVATGKVTAHAGTTNGHWRLAGDPVPRKPKPAPHNLRTAPSSLTPLRVDAIMHLADQMAGVAASASDIAPARPLSLREVVEMEAAEAGRRRAQAWSNESMTAPFTVRRPTPVLTAPTLAGGDRRPFAASREPCVRCQAGGDLGCAHQRPFEAGSAA